MCCLHRQTATKSVNACTEQEATCVGVPPNATRSIICICSLFLLCSKLPCTHSVLCMMHLMICSSNFRVGKASLPALLPKVQPCGTRDRPETNRKKRRRSAALNPCRASHSQPTSWRSLSLQRSQTTLQFRCTYTTHHRCAVYIHHHPVALNEIRNKTPRSEN